MKNGIKPKVKRDKKERKGKHDDDDRLPKRNDPSQHGLNYQTHNPGYKIKITPHIANKKNKA
jgi:hypothetical protein